MTRKNKWFLVVFSLLFLFALLRFYQLSPLTAASASARDLFHERFNQGQYRDIYFSATEEFKHKFDEKAFTDLLITMKREIGTVREASTYKWGYRDEPAGRVVYFIATTTFRSGLINSKTVHETFEFFVAGNEMKLHSYENDYFPKP